MVGGMTHYTLHYYKILVYNGCCPSCINARSRPRTVRVKNDPIRTTAERSHAHTAPVNDAPTLTLLLDGCNA